MGLCGGAPKVDGTTIFNELVSFEKDMGRMPSQYAVKNAAKELRAHGVSPNSTDWAAALTKGKAEVSLY